MDVAHGGREVRVPGQLHDGIGGRMAMSRKARPSKGLSGAADGTRTHDIQLGKLPDQPPQDPWYWRVFYLFVDIICWVGGGSSPTRNRSV